LADGGALISPETSERVRAAIQTLGYQPDSRAQALRSGETTNTIGLLVPDMHNPFYWKIASGVEQEAQKAGFDLSIYSTSLNADREEYTLRALSRRQIGGLILNLTFPSRIGITLKRLSYHYPMVILSGPIFGLDAVQVAPGYGELMHALIAHLFDLGHRKIGFIYGVASPEADGGSPEGGEGGRLVAYRQALCEFGLAADEQLIERCGATLEDGYAATLRLLRRAPGLTALVTINDLMAFAAMRAVNQLGLSVPQDISLVGFDNIDLAAYMNPPLTTVQYDADSVGREAVKLLLARIQEPERPRQIVSLPTRLVIRQSTATVRATDAIYQCSALSNTISTATSVTQQQPTVVSMAS
jgi:LacI family transcriptional regulator